MRLRYLARMNPTTSAPSSTPHPPSASFPSSILHHTSSIPAVFACLLLATAFWLACVHHLFTQPVATFASATGIPPHARALAERQLDLWATPALKAGELNRIRRSNAEWDFMGRSFFVWSLAELCLREPASAPRYLTAMDTVIDETLQLETEMGMTVFLMPYAKLRPFVVRPARSLFVDGEIALMLAARCAISPHEGYRAALQTRVNDIVARLQASPLGIAESYPDECWMFDHAVALAAIRLADHVEGHSAHAAFLADWLAQARARWIDPATGLLVSSFSTAGDIGDGPEGSSIWGTLHFLSVIDPTFARAQYDLARREFRRDLAGFAWSREWPRSWRGQNDIDAGMVIPGLDISAGGSGMAFLGASTFGDTDYLSRLHATLDFAAFPIHDHGRLRYGASNLVGDAVMLYAGVLGPLWHHVNPATRLP